MFGSAAGLFSAVCVPDRALPETSGELAVALAAVPSWLRPSDTPGTALSSNGALRASFSASPIEGSRAAKLNNVSWGSWLDPGRLALAAFMSGVCNVDSPAGDCCSKASGVARVDIGSGTGAGTGTGKNGKWTWLDSAAGFLFSELFVLSPFNELSGPDGFFEPFRLAVATEALA